MGGKTLQQNLQGRLSTNDTFLLAGFYVSSKFCAGGKCHLHCPGDPDTVAGVISFPDTTYKQICFLYIYFFPYPFRNSPMTMESKFILDAGRRCSDMTGENSATTE